MMQQIEYDISHRTPMPRLPNPPRQKDFQSGQGEGIAEAGSEDRMMVPQVMPMPAVAAEPFESPVYSFEIKYDGVRGKKPAKPPASSAAAPRQYNALDAAALVLCENDLFVTTLALRRAG